MKFFIPGMENEKERDNTYNKITSFAKLTMGQEITNRKIFSITYFHDGREYYAEVGKDVPRVRETCIAILESNAFLICTPNRGVFHDIPVIVGHEEVRKIVDFE